MRERGDYVIPYFNDKYRFDKPPFIYWTQMASYSLFGENDFAARFPSTIAAALTAVLLFAWGRRLGSERIGWWAAIIFTLCLQVFIHAKAAVADMWLVFFVTAASWAGFELLADSLGRAVAPDLETARPRAVGTSLLLLRCRWRLEPKNRLAFLHQIKAVPRHCFKVGRIGLEQIHFPGLASEQNLLIVHLTLKCLDFSLALTELFVRGQKQTDDDEDRRHREQDAKDAVEALPDGGFTPRAEIAVPRMFH
jgi:hypothetical protein